jgi:hypothetical protein
MTSPRERAYAAVLDCFFLDADERADATMAMCKHFERCEADARRAALEEAAKRLDAMLGEAWHDVAVAEASKDWEVDHHRERSKCFELARNSVLALLTDPARAA